MSNTPLGKCLFFSAYNYKLQCFLMDLEFLLGELFEIYLNMYRAARYVEHKNPESRHFSPMHTATMVRF
jgi:hypothetical protein